MAKWIREISKDAKEKVVESAQQKLIAIGLLMETEIKVSMRSGSGRVYKHGGRTHIASAPNQPPAVDTGRLRASISTNWTGSGMSRGKVDSLAKAEDGVGMPTDTGFHVYVGTNVDYAYYLEYGTKKMAPRPFMRPVFDRIKSRFHDYASGSIVSSLKK